LYRVGNEGAMLTPFSRGETRMPFFIPFAMGGLVLTALAGADAEPRARAG
jgi:hypothetical protein